MHARPTKHQDLDRAIPKIWYARRAAVFLCYAFILCAAYHLCFKELNVLRAVELWLSAALDTRTSAKYRYSPERCRVSSGNFLIIRSAQSFSCSPSWTFPFFLEPWIQERCKAFSDFLLRLWLMLMLQICFMFNPLNPELNPICYLLALLEVLFSTLVG